jgi:hypothetical protein
MNEGLRFLAHQLAWEQTLGELRQRAETERRRSEPATLPMSPVSGVQISARTANEIVGGDSFEAA